ncbi:HEAT repeat domain-containing protein [Actinoplanes sp. NPDC051861]|uniref:HEAT repeat domain-containing protein n=1 Tax=Actinoplanes sp. NPDC051861 TaxID=3155170 RepID=UPI003436A91E
MSALEHMSISALIGRLDDSDPGAVYEAIEELGRREATEAAPHLLEMLRTSDDAAVRNYAALALSDMRNPEVLDVIAGLLQDPRTAGSRGTLLYALEPYDCSPILELLVDLAITGNWEVSRSALGLLTGVNGDIGEELWSRLRDRVLAALSTADEEQRIEVLEPLLEMFV